MNILAFESSCDETAVAVVKNGRDILASSVLSQIDIHSLYGGVVPEIASREHLSSIVPLTKSVLEKINEPVDAVAATCAPGLIGALLVGINFAKSYAFAKNLPFIPVHHIRSHIAAAYLSDKNLKPPFLAAVVSGGHTIFLNVQDYTEMKTIGTTRDDAAGEAFDKVARVLGLGYPGGPAVSCTAAEYNGEKHSYKLPNPEIENFPYDTSFSGIKTALINLVRNAEQRGEEINKPALCNLFEQTVCNAIVPRIVRASKEFGLSEVVFAGGVAANSALRQSLTDALGEHIHIPPISLCGDNAAMVASQAFYEYEKGNLGDTSQNGFATMSVEKSFVIL